MSQLKTIRRVTVYADATLEESLLEKFLELGSTGYTVVPCRGKGEHALVTDPFSAVTQVRIELLVQPAVAEKIVAYLGSGHFQSRAIAACVETVEVAANERF
jgi:hypothetical protein